MKLYNIKTSYGNNEIRVSINVDSDKLGKQKLWFSTSKSYEKYVAEDRYDAFLVGLLYPALVYGENIFIDGAVSSKLLFNINNYVIKLIKTFSPSCKLIKVEAKEVIDSDYNGKGIGTGFSGGVDSFYTIYKHYEQESDPNYKINSMLFLNVGSHGSAKDEVKTREKFITRFNYLKAFPEELGLDFIAVDSNLHFFHPWGHQLTDTLTLTAGVLFLQKWYGKYYCASMGLSFKDVFAKYDKYFNFDIAILEIILLPLLSTESLEFIPDGSQVNRTEKTLEILNYEPVYRYLNVCVSGDETYKNCSVCGKCTRTLLTLSVAGKLNDFQNIFDIEKYKKIEKNIYVNKSC